MAIYPCPECGKPISDKAETCPNCGCPVDADQLRQRALAKQKTDKAIVQRHRRQQATLGVLVLFALVLIAVGLMLKGTGFIALLGLLVLLIALLWITSIEETIQKREASEAPAGGCPKCKSTSIAALKEGYSAGSGCCGAVLLGPLGLLCGLLGAGEVNVHCLDCGHKWRAKR